MKNNSNSIPRLVVRAINVFICNSIALCFLINMFGIRLSGGLIAVIAGASFVSVLICAAKRFRVALVAVYFIGTIVFAALNWGALAVGASELGERFVSLASNAYGVSYDVEVASAGSGSQLLLLEVVEIFACMVLAYAYSAKKNYFGWISLAFATVTVALVLYLFPPAVIVIAFFCMIVYLKITSSWERSNSKSAAYHCIAAMLALLLATFFCIGIWSEDRHEDSLKDSEIRKSVREWNAKLSTKIGDFVNGRIEAGDDSTAGMSGGRVGKGSVRSTSRTDLVVYMPANSPQTYLKGYTGVSYVAGVWREDNRYSYEYYKGYSDYWSQFANGSEEMMPYELSSQVFDNRGTFPDAESRYPLYKAEITIAVLGASKAYTYVPYCSGYGEIIYNTRGVPNSLAVDGKLLESGSGLTLTEFGDSYHRMGSDYMAGYAYDMCTEVPREFANALQPVIDEYYNEYLPKHPATDYHDILNGKVDFVKQYMRQNYVYTTRPPKNKSDKDPVLFFIEDSHAGYCQHFSSTAIMILRLLDVPTRYAEGYVVHGAEIATAKKTSKDLLAKGDIKGEITDYWGDPREREESYCVIVNVPNKNAHAWAEIWIDDYGWFPVEATVGFESSVREWEVPVPTPQIDPGTLVPTQGTAPTPKGGTNPATKADKDKDDTSKSIDPIVWYWVAFGSIVVLFVFAVAGRSAWIRECRRKRFLSKNTKKASIAIYKDILKLASAMGVVRGDGEADREFHDRLAAELPELNEAEPFGRIEEIAERAAYDCEKITSEERRTMLQYYRKLRSAYLSKQNVLQKIFALVFRGL